MYSNVDENFNKLNNNNPNLHITVYVIDFKP